ncbi:MAG: DNA alkylation repair protein [Blastocatellia bacterium]|nr:DNA alkylation repair protein [Blastocatellia bacterium]
MSAADILKELELLGSESYKKTMMVHGAREPIFGVKISDLKKIVRRVGTDYQLALHLFESGNYDAMYLAGLVADATKMTRKDLQRWLDQAYCSGIYEYTVPWVAGESAYGWELGLKWIESGNEQHAAAGWSTLSAVAGRRDDADLDIPAFKKLLDRVAKTIHTQPNRVKYTMNGFVIAVGSHIAPLHKDAVAAGKSIGKVSVDMNGTSCKVPFAPDYIKKVEARGSIGKKRRDTRC